MLMRLFRSLMPKEERFVEHFSAHADRLLAAADALASSMTAARVDQPARFEEVSSIESEADTIARQTIVALHRAFITPFDRSDIHALITALDDAVDLMEEVVDHASLYGVEVFDSRMRELALLIQKAAAPLAETMPLLTDITRNAERITELCAQVGKIEREADKVLRLALSELIAERPETITFLARKEVYELLEAVTDRCDDVADVIEGVVLDHV
ncbi:MAG TPA: DUF47 family protein [Azospirillaceae bacterium]|nr:DUF47 family protein [Azospirillaceae bacterium]